jgi:hypothetical protein
MKTQRRFAPIGGLFKPDSVACLPGMRIFAGRGGTAGGSWGSFGNDLPAKALLNGEKVLVLDKEFGQEYRDIVKCCV